jgi:UDP-N-acetylmuramoyl-tripeptide--D-alanyl-D-alanine ligase
MIKRTLQEIERMAQGEGLAEPFHSQMIHGVSIDSRTVVAGNLFIPIVRIDDGHKYVREAFNKGAKASLWQKDHPNPPHDIPLIFVDDTLKALQNLARSYREQLPVKVIGVTGSNGKTTTKDMISAILSEGYNVHKTQGNLNSQYGLPLSLLALEENTDIAVLEMGMSERGQIERLSRIATPDATIITMIGVSHLETLGSRDEIANAKLEITSGLKNGGIFIYNGDEPLLEKGLQHINLPNSVQLIRFGESDKNDYYPVSYTETSDAISFSINRNPSIPYSIPLLGKHNIYNAIASIAVAEQLGAVNEHIKAGLQSVKITPMRMEKVIGISGLTIINDAWNASPHSMKAAIETFQELSEPVRKFVVLGDMLELGAGEIEYHTEIGKMIDPDKIDYVYTFGKLSHHIAAAAKENFGVERVRFFADKEELIRDLQSLVKPQDFVLVKGSRGMALEEVVEKLAN